MNQGYFVRTVLDANPLIFALADLGAGIPPTIWAKPVAGDTIRVDTSLDGGNVWEAALVSTTANWSTTLSSGVTHIRFTRTIGTGTTSRVGVC